MSILDDELRGGANSSPSSNGGAPLLVEGVVVDASNLETGLEVVTPGWDSSRHAWGPAPWPAAPDRPPENGDGVLLALVEQSRPWVVSWWPKKGSWSDQTGQSGGGGGGAGSSAYIEVSLAATVTANAWSAPMTPSLVERDGDAGAFSIVADGVIVRDAGVYEFNLSVSGGPPNTPATQLVAQMRGKSGVD